MNKAVELMQRAAAAGVTLKLVDGEVRYRGSRAAMAELLGPLREVKAEVQRILEDELIPIDVQAESYRVLSRLATPTPKRANELPGLTARMVIDARPPPPVAPPQPWHHIDADWRPLAVAYNLHHTTCKVCHAAGQGRGLRCGTGAALWTPYQEVFDK